MKSEITAKMVPILAAYDPGRPIDTADALRRLWLQYESKSIGAIKAEQREQQETVGIAVPVLKAIGQEIGKAARKRVEGFIPLTRLLWDAYGREGRVVAAIPLGKMELVAPKRIMPMLMILCRTCVTWEDADRLAMDSLEPIVRKEPEQWLSAMEPWLRDENKWVRRTGVTVVGPTYVHDSPWQVTTGLASAAATGSLSPPSSNISEPPTTMSTATKAAAATTTGLQPRVRSSVGCAWIVSLVSMVVLPSIVGSAASSLVIGRRFGSGTGLACMNRAYTRSVSFTMRHLLRTRWPA